MPINNGTGCTLPHACGLIVPHTQLLNPHRWSYLTKHTHQTTHHTTPANATPSAVPAGLAPVQTLRPPSTTSSPAHPDRNKPTTSKTAAQSSGYQQTMVPLSAVHAVLPRMLQHVLDLACEKDYPEESLHFLGGCLSASQTHLHAFLDNVLLQAAQQGLSTRCAQSWIAGWGDAVQMVWMTTSHDNLTCMPPLYTIRSATPRGVETPPNPSASRPSATKPAGMSHSILSTQQQQQQQQQRRAPTAAPPHNSTKQVIVQGTTGTAWGMQDKDGRPLLVRKTVGAMLEERKAYKAARMAMQHSVAGSKQ